MTTPVSTSSGSATMATADPASHEATQAADTLARYMQDNNIRVVNLDDLSKLARDPAAPQAVVQATKFFIDNPEVYQKIETHDVPGVDGISGIWNFQAAAKGEIPDLAPPTDGTSPNQDIIDQQRALARQSMQDNLEMAKQSATLALAGKTSGR